MPARHCLLFAITCFAFLMGQSSAAEPPGPDKRVRTDSYGDPLPKGARFRLGTVRLRHDAAVTAIAWLPDGHTLASAGFDDTVRLWQIPGGKQLAKWDKMENAVFSPDGRTLACGGDGGPIRFHDLATGKELRRLTIPTAIYPYVFSPDGKTLAVVQFQSKRGVRLYAADSGKEVRFLEGKVPPGINPVAFSPDGQTLAVGMENGGLCCWQTATGKKLQTLACNGAFSLAFSHDGKMLAAGTGDGASSTYRLWSWPAGKELDRFARQEVGDNALTFSLDSRILATANSQNIRLWNLTTGKELRRFEGHWTDVMHLAFSPDGSLLASAGTDGVITLWELRTKNPPRPLTGVGHRLDALAATADGLTLLTHTRDGRLVVWDGHQGCPRRTLDNWNEVSMTLLMAPDGSRALALPLSGEPPVWWDTATGRRLPSLAGRSDTFTCAAFSPDSTMLALGELDGTIHLRETVKGAALRCLNEGKDSSGLAGLAWSPDGRTLAASYSDGSLTLWDPQGSRMRHRLPGRKEGLTKALTFSSDSRMLAMVREDRLIHLCEVVSGQEIRTFRGPPTSIKTLAFAPDSRTLASGGGRGFNSPNDIPHPLPFGSPEAAIGLWDVPSGKQFDLLPGHQTQVHTLAFSSDGTTLISGSDDNTVLSWDVAALTRQRPAGKELSADRLAALWTDLAARDAARAQRAVAELIQAPDAALPFLEESLPPILPLTQAEKSRIAEWIADLDHADFARRERASKELEKAGELAAPALRKVLKEKPSLEVRKRIEILLEAINERPTSPDGLRTFRALQVLETIGTPKAKKILQGLAGGAAEAALTQEAKAALQRLSRRNTNR